MPPDTENSMISAAPTKNDTSSDDDKATRSRSASPAKAAKQRGQSPKKTSPSKQPTPSDDDTDEGNASPPKRAPGRPKKEIDIGFARTPRKDSKTNGDEGGLWGVAKSIETTIGTAIVDFAEKTGLKSPSPSRKGSRSASPAKGRSRSPRKPQKGLSDSEDSVVEFRGELSTSRKGSSTSKKETGRSSRQASPSKKRSVSGASTRSRSESPVKGRSKSPAKGRSKSPAKGRAKSPVKGRSVSPAKGRARSPRKQLEQHSDSDDDSQEAKIEAAIRATRARSKSPAKSRQDSTSTTQGRQGSTSTTMGRKGSGSTARGRQDSTSTIPSRQDSTSTTMGQQGSTVPQAMGVSVRAVPQYSAREIAEAKRSIAAQMAASRKREKETPSWLSRSPIISRQGSAKTSVSGLDVDNPPALSRPGSKRGTASPSPARTSRQASPARSGARSPIRSSNERLEHGLHLIATAREQRVADATTVKLPRRYDVAPKVSTGGKSVQPKFHDVDDSSNESSTSAENTPHGE